MKHASSIIFAALLLCASFAVTHADTPVALTLEDIFSKTNSIRYLSYQTKITSPAGSVRKYKIWIYEDSVYVFSHFEKMKPWHPEKEEAYLKMLQMDQQDNLMAKQKIDAWEDFLKTISEKDPSTRRDDQMRFKSRTRIYYWKYASRFLFYPNGIIKDTLTGLEWFVGPARDTSWEEACSLVSGLEIDGGGWRLPTIDELKNVHEKSVFERFPPPFYKKTGWHLWSAENRKKVSCYYFDYIYWRKRSNNKTVSKNMRAAAVRGQK